MIGLVTDSNSQIPEELARRYQVAIVPLTVTIDGTAYLEGVDIDADRFYARFEEARTPEVATSQPSPGRFSAAYDALADAGAGEILSIHIGSNLSGTVNSARLAAQSAPVPVHIVDTGTASFAVSCCVWEAGEALARGAGMEEAAAAAEAVKASVGNVFVVRALDFARAGGRLADAEAGTGEAEARTGEPATEEHSGDGIPVLTLGSAGMRPIGQARTVDDAVALMSAYVAEWGGSLRVGVGLADRGMLPIVTRLEESLRASRQVREVVRYRIGPSVGAHTGPGTVGLMFYPAPS